MDLFYDWINAGEKVYVSMYAGYTEPELLIPSHPRDFNLRLRSPTCEIVDQSEQVEYLTPFFNLGAEEIVHIAWETGWWHVEVYSAGLDYGAYDLWWDHYFPGCYCGGPDPATVEIHDAPWGQPYYVEERGDPLDAPVTEIFPMGNERTWTYEEANSEPGVQRGGIGLLGDWFPPGCDQNWALDPQDPALPEGWLPCLIIDEDPIIDENCGKGPDALVV